MIPVKRGLLLDEAAIHLRREIEAGNFLDELPSCRDLAASLQVSVPTLLAALERLVEEGLLEKGKPRRPYRVTANASTLKISNDGKRRILVISSKPLGEYDANSRSAVDKLILDAMRQGIEFQHRIVSYLGVRRPNPRWDEVLDEVRPTQLIALGGSLVLAEWADRRKIPTLFIGGIPGQTKVTAIGVSLQERLEEVLDRLLDKGHRHICMPLGELEEFFVSRMQSAFQNKLAERGIPYVPTYHTPIAARGGKKATGALIHNVLSARQPTAMIFIEWIDFVSAIGRLAEHQLAFGRDVVAVILTHDPQLESFHPQPAHFRLPVQRLERMLGDWIKNPHTPRFRKGGLMLQPSRFCEGDAFFAAPVFPRESRPLAQ